MLTFAAVCKEERSLFPITVFSFRTPAGDGNKAHEGYFDVLVRSNAAGRECLLKNQALLGGTANRPVMTECVEGLIPAPPTIEVEGLIPAPPTIEDELAAIWSNHHTSGVTEDRDVKSATHMSSHTAMREFLAATQPKGRRQVSVSFGITSSKKPATSVIRVPFAPNCALEFDIKMK